MKKSAKIPRILKINAVKDWQVFVAFNNGAQRVIDFAAFFQQHHFATDPLRSRLLDPAVFQQLELHEGTLRWPQLLQRIELGEGLTFEVPFDLDPIVLYDFSVLDSTRSGLEVVG